MNIASRPICLDKIREVFPVSRIPQKIVEDTFGIFRLHRNRAKAQITEEFKTLDTNADDLLSFEEFGKLGKQ